MAALKALAKEPEWALGWANGQVESMGAPKAKPEAQASSAVAFDGLRIPPVETKNKKAQLAGAGFVHVLGQFAELIRSCAQRLGGMRPDRGHHFVVQISDDFFLLALEFLRCVAELGVQFASNIPERRFELGIVL
jgi:hypothetical protein